MLNRKILLLLLGPTGVGKTELSLRVAEHFGCPIVSCDSRQVFREIPVGTAAPTPAEQARVKHYFIGTRSVEEDYSAGQFERDAMELLERLFAVHDVVVMTGGSMLYADAICNGLDDLPPVPEEIRREVSAKGRQAGEAGLAWLQAEVQRLDPDYWATVDRLNPARLAHCVELCLTTGKPYSSLRTETRKERPFTIVKIGLERPRAELYDRINRRVDEMMNAGLPEEAERVYHQRHLTSLQTVGYKELFGCMDGEYTLERAVELIKQHTRNYAKRQMTWFRRDKEIHWLKAENDYETNIRIIDSLLHDSLMQESGR